MSDPKARGATSVLPLPAREGQHRRSTLFRRLGLPLAVACIAIGLHLGGDTAFLLLRYDRAAILQGEWWRLFTGHLLHLGRSHLLLNLAGFAVTWALVGRQLALPEWGYIAGTCALLTGLGLLVFSPEVVWYVGLSGVLHGLLVAGLLRYDADDRPLLAPFLLAAIGIKLFYEQTAGALPSLATTGSVIVDAHLWGALSGAVVILLLDAGKAWLAGARAGQAAHGREDP